MRLAPVDAQLGLFYHHKTITCDSSASARNAYGDAAQEIVYSLLGITPIRINGSFEVCFDGKRGDTYYEIKGTKLGSGKVVIYDFRMAKERATGVPLNYLIVCHSLRGHRDDILTAMADRPITIYQIPASVVYAFAEQCDLRFLQRPGKSKRCGYSRAGYIDGYRNVPLKWMAGECKWTETSIENTIGTGVVTLRTYGGLLK